MALPATIEALLLRNSRSMTPEGGSAIIPDVVLHEHHDDEMVVTEHPVERGAPIADHTYKKPETLSVRFGWSDSSALLNQAVSLSLLSGLTSITDVYAKLLEEMEKGTLFEVSTGKRRYTDMLITSVSVKTEEDTETALIVDITFQKVNFVTTTETDGSVASVASQAMAKDTAAPRSLGDRLKTKVGEVYDSVGSLVDDVIDGVKSFFN